MQWNPFKKSDPKEEQERAKLEEAMKQASAGKDMNMIERFAMKRFLSMKPEDREKVLQKAMKPENVAKHKDDILGQLEAMKKSGQMSDDQYRLAKRRLGL